MGTLNIWQTPWLFSIRVGTGFLLHTYWPKGTFMPQMLYCNTSLPCTLAAYIATWMSKQTYILERECSYRKMLYCDISRSIWRFCAMLAEKQKSLFLLAVDIQVAMWTHLWLVESSSRHLLLSQFPHHCTPFSTQFSMFSLFTVYN